MIQKLVDCRDCGADFCERHRPERPSGCPSEGHIIQGWLGERYSWCGDGERWFELWDCSGTAFSSLGNFGTFTELREWFQANIVGD